eukprot:1832101-Heterocapsa_arctica.AAC.1
MLKFKLGEVGWRWVVFVVLFACRLLESPCHLQSFALHNYVCKWTALHVQMNCTMMPQSV